MKLDGAARRVLAILLRCPRCDAALGEDCRDGDGRELDRPHVERVAMVGERERLLDERART